MTDDSVDSVCQNTLLSFFLSVSLRTILIKLNWATNQCRDKNIHCVYMLG